MDIKMNGKIKHIILVLSFLWMMPSLSHAQIDPTADSLHVGHFMALCLMKRLQMAGNKPVVLIGGGTAQIGDPSGRSDMRQMMTTETTTR